MNRTELQQLAEDRMLDAQQLLAAGRWSGAYYLAGYAVECGLKACIAKLTNAEDFPPKVKVVPECYTHDLNKLLKAGELKALLDAATATVSNPPGTFPSRKKRLSCDFRPVPKSTISSGA